MHFVVVEEDPEAGHGVVAIDDVVVLVGLEAEEAFQVREERALRTNNSFGSEDLIDGRATQAP